MPTTLISTSPCANTGDVELGNLLNQDSLRKRNMIRKGLKDMFQRAWSRGNHWQIRRLVVSHLLASQEVSIRGFCRNPSKLPEHLRNSSRLTIVSGDAGDLDTLRQFVRGTDVVVCCYLGDNTLMTEGQKLLVDACDLESVPRYMASDYCLDYTKLEYGQHPAKDPMKRVKAYLETKKNVKGVHVLIGAFMETFWSGYFGVFDSKDCKFSFYGTGDEIWESTTYDTAAQYVAAVALDRNAIGLLHCKY